MKRIICSFAIALLAVSLLAPTCAADDPSALMLKQDGYTVSLSLKFTKKSQNSLEHALAFLDWGPNGYATGFAVGNGLVMTAYHVVSGDLSVSKKAQLGFSVNDQLKVKAYVNGCEATVLKVDVDADLALLRVCQSQKNTRAPAFQASMDKDEKLLLIARPHGDKLVKRGVYYGPYMSRGLQYWAAKIDVHDGYSGSPVYNNRAELIGVFSGYDWSKKLALISPGSRAQKLLEDYTASPQP
ncbi:MAG: Trypsin-like peptidase domain [Acidobacteriota bacterium]|jgi:S1-C subfamily serine protease|nr:Trypsin-like peptidase domain [Acidobacteriota bacterium]